MARTTFSRTVITTICEVKYIDENNDIQEAQVELYGDYDIDGAQNAARKKMNNNRLVVQKVRHKSFYGTITLEQFAKICERKNEKEW